MRSLSAIICSLFLLFYTDVVSASGDWGYGADDGPSTWPTKFPTCDGTSQSPIDIQTKDVKYSQTNLKPFTLTKTGATKTNILKNIGSKVEVEMKEEWKASLEGSPKECFQLVQTHWHWGLSDTKGSEHRIDGKYFPLELHAVMYNCRDFKNVQDALKGPNGLAVLGVLYEIDDNAPANAAFNNFVNNFETAAFKQKTSSEPTIDLPKFDINEFLPSNKKDFYRYMGSLTTPPCTQNVLWTVYKNPVKITSSQMSKFRLLRTPENKVMGDNYRPVQPLNPQRPTTAIRVVSASFSGAPVQFSYSTTLTLSVFLFVIRNLFF